MTRKEFIHQYCIHHTEEYSTINLVGCAEAVANEITKRGYNFDEEE